MLGPFRICNIGDQYLSLDKFRIQCSSCYFKSKVYPEPIQKIQQYKSLVYVSNSSKSKRVKHFGHTCDVLQGGRGYQSWHRVGPEWPQKRVNFWRIFFAPIFGRNFFAPMFGRNFEGLPTQQRAQRGGCDRGVGPVEPAQGGFHPLGLLTFLLFEICILSF